MSSVPQHKQLRHAYGFDDVAIVPGNVTINPDMVDVSFVLGEMKMEIPILASSMDAVVDPKFAIEYGKMGGLAVMNLEGLQTRYENPDEILAQVAAASRDEATVILQKAYQQPVRPDLVQKRVRAMKEAGIICAVAASPAATKKLAPLAAEAGADLFFVQSTVTTVRHISRSEKGLRLDELCRELTILVVVGNTVDYHATRELMETGVAAVLIGVGPGSACTSREVLGIGVPQVTATIDCAAARDHFFSETGRYIPIITDGGMRTGGDMCKAMVAGADAVMIGSPFTATDSAPGRGHHWGMATPNMDLPRGTRVSPGINTTLQRLIHGPTSRTDGTENLVGALRTSMGTCGARNIREFHGAEMVIAPSIKTEGKIYQMAQR